MSQRAHVLVTNDDGIHSFFLRNLVEGLMESFRVTVVAPKSEQSWIGRAVSRHREVHVSEYGELPCRAFVLDGTPSDCVNIALGHLLKDDFPDLVCSGINIGFNATLPLILSSGTVAGATEGACWGLPAFAFSHQIPPGSYEDLRRNNGYTEGPLAESLKAASRHAAAIVTNRLNDHRNGDVIVHNINFPCYTDANTPIRLTEPAPFRIGSLFTPKTEASYHFRYTQNKPEFAENYDNTCIEKGFISHGVLNFSSLGKNNINQ